MTAEPSGIDLARTALAQAKAAAKARGDAPGKAKKSTGKNLRAARPRGTGREPSALAGVLTDLADARGWQQGTTGGDILGRWADLVPDLAPNVRAVHYDTERRRLDLLPLSPAFATGLRLMQQQLIARLNGKLGQDAVRSIRVLAPAHGNLPTQDAHLPQDSGAGPQRLPDVGNGAPPTPEMRTWRAATAKARTQPEAPVSWQNPILADGFGRLREDESTAKAPTGGAFRIPDAGEAAEEEEAERIRERDKAVLQRARADKAARATGGMPTRIGDPQPIRDTTAA